MQSMQWRGVIPAITTPFRSNGSVDHEFFSKHCAWLIDNGCTGIVVLGSLGEGGTLTREEKTAVLKTAVATLKNRAPVIAGIAALSTAEAVQLAEDAEKAGCDGLMVLPPYVYTGDWREMKAHVSAVLRATGLSSMLYNNPIAYTTDFLPEHVTDLLETHPNLHAIKESSADVRRIAALRRLAGERLQILCGVDDLIVEAVYAGATGWIAGLVNAFPAESVELFNLAIADKKVEAFELYKWFLPLLRLDTVPKFVQLIKHTQEIVGMGSSRVRLPRLELSAAEAQSGRDMVERAIASGPLRSFASHRR